MDAQQKSSIQKAPLYLISTSAKSNKILRQIHAVATHFNKRMYGQYNIEIILLHPTSKEDISTIRKLQAKYKRPISEGILVTLNGTPYFGPNIQKFIIQEYANQNPTDSTDSKINRMKQTIRGTDINDGEIDRMDPATGKMKERDSYSEDISPVKVHTQSKSDSVNTRRGGNGGTTETHSRRGQEIKQSSSKFGASEISAYKDSIMPSSMASLASMTEPVDYAAAFKKINISK